MNVTFDNTYARLPERFFSSVEPETSSNPETIVVNEELARRLGFDPQWLESREGAEFIVGNRILDESEPIALVYAGHQFGNWVPRLGDGRAVLLGEVLDEDGQRYDVQLKGSGRTPYSRQGDGRAPLGPVLREYLVAESMAALGIPTTRALAAASTGDPVLRQRSLPGAVLVRVAKSHIRVGTFEYFASREDSDAIELLIDYTLERHYPESKDGGAVELLRGVADRQAKLIARWQLLGFIHGVMNTDNMLLSGETVDYGPCAYMNEYDPETVYSSIDRHGRYAYGNQPVIGQWNLARFAQALMVGIGGDDEQEHFLEEAQQVIDEFPQKFRGYYCRGMAKKLGLEQYGDDDWPLIEDLLELMAESESDYTLTFRGLTELRGDAEETTELFSLSEVFDDWIERWRKRLDTEKRSEEEQHLQMSRENPVFIPRNHLVAAALGDAVEQSDYGRFYELLEVLDKPFEYRSELERFARPPAPDERVEATFCGT